MRLSKLLSFCLLSALALASGACNKSTEFLFNLTVERIDRSGVSFLFSANEPLSRVEVFDGSGELIRSLSIPLLLNGHILIPLSPAVGEYEIIAVSINGSRRTAQFDFPDTSGSSISISSPFSIGFGSAVLLPPGSETSLLATIYGRLGNPMKYRLTVHSRDDILLSQGGETGEWKRALELTGEAAYLVRPVTRQILIRTSKQVKTGEYLLEAEAELDYGEGRQDKTTTKLRLVIKGRDELAGAILIEKTVMPTDANGRGIPGGRQDFLTLRGDSNFAESGRGNINQGSLASRAVSYQTVLVKSALDLEVPVLLSSQVLDCKSVEVSAFRAPPGHPGTASQVATILPPRGEAVVPLPIFADPVLAEPGSYTRRIDLQLAGTDLILDRETRPLIVERPADVALLATAASVIITILLFAIVILRGNAILSRFTTRQIVLLALVSAASVVIVNIPVFFLANITFSLLGPFGFLVDALLTEFLYGALLVALVAIIPRQGVCTIVALVRFLLGGVLLGMLTPVGAIHTAISAIFLELAVWLSGIAREESARNLNTGFLLLFACAWGLVSWIGFQLSIVLFRLHYADWYVVISVVIGGFVYSLVGAIAGRRIGNRLARITA